MSADIFMKGIQSYVLKMCIVGSDPTNYRIIQMLPATVNEIKHEIGLTKMPVYHRLNKLADYGLINWNKYSRKKTVIEKGKLTDSFLSAFDDIFKFIKNKKLSVLNDEKALEDLLKAAFSGKH